MNILMLSNTFPYPPTKGGTQVRTFHLLKYLNHFHSVTLLTQRSAEVSNAEIQALREFVSELVVFEKQIDRSNKLQRFANFLIEGTPPSVRSNYSPAMQAWIDQHLDKFDVVTCEHSVNEAYIRPEFRNKVKTIVNAHSSVYGTCHNQLQTGTSENEFRDRINLPLLKRYEKRFCNKFSNIVVTTEDDRAQVESFNPNADISVIPNGVDFTEFPYRTADPGGHHLVFIGAMDNLANIDAAKFLTLEILPQIQIKYPDATLSLVGARPTPEILELQDRATVTGRVDSIANYLHRATVCVIPMRTGYGIKNKTLEAMAAGTPIVSSDRGLEGLQFNDPICALQANTIGEYVATISRLFEDAELRSQLSHNARSLIENNYTWERAGHQYLQVLERK
jgi:polysaccharide biosynthesis protein PslH